MFGYKLKPWYYSMYDAKAITAEMNEMAAGGYEFWQAHMGIFFQYLIYRRREKGEAKPHYEAVMLPWGGEERLRLYQDAGWERIAQLEKGVTLFQNCEEKPRPLFTDEVSRLETEEEGVRKWGGSTSSIVIYGILLFLSVTDLGRTLLRGEAPDFITWYLGIIFFLYFAGTLGERIQLRRRRELAELGILSERSPWPGRIRKVRMTVLIVLLTGLFCVYLIRGLIEPDWAILGLSCAIPVFYLAGMYLEIRKKEEELRWIFQILPVTLLILVVFSRDMVVH